MLLLLNLSADVSSSSLTCPSEVHCELARGNLSPRFSRQQEALPTRFLTTSRGSLNAFLPSGTRHPRLPQNSGWNKPFLQRSAWEITGAVTLGGASLLSCTERGSGRGQRDRQRDRHRDGVHGAGGHGFRARQQCVLLSSVLQPPRKQNRTPTPYQPQRNQGEFLAVASVLRPRSTKDSQSERISIEHPRWLCHRLHTVQSMRVCVFSFDFLPSFLIPVCCLNM